MAVNVDKMDVNDIVRAYIAQIEGLRADIAKLDAAISALRQSLSTLKSLKELGEGKTVLVPVGEITQVEMKIEKMDKIVVSVGQNISAELSYDETLKYIENEISKLTSYRLILEQAIAEIYTRIEEAINNSRENTEKGNNESEKEKEN